MLETGAMLHKLKQASSIPLRGTKALGGRPLLLAPAPRDAAMG